MSLWFSELYGQAAVAGHYEQPVIEVIGLSQRGVLLHHLNNEGVTVPSGRCDESWRTMYRDIKLLSDKARTLELLSCSHSVSFQGTRIG